jgi:hypothetical protein
LIVPVRKFRDVSEMEDTVWHDRTDPALHRTIASVWDFAARTCPLKFPPGVHKHRSVADADVRRDHWEEANFRAFQARRHVQRLPSK